MHEAKTHLSRLVEAALAGEEVIITRRDQPVVRLTVVPPPSTRKHPLIGALPGLIIAMGDNFNDPYEDWDTPIFPPEDGKVQEPPAAVAAPAKPVVPGSLLLDTHALLWVLADDPRLDDSAREQIEQAKLLLFSTASLWEIAIKCSLGREDFRMPSDWWLSIPRALVALGAQRLDILPEHCGHIAILPLHHRDPFDRLLVAQAIASGSSILSIDPQLDAYGIRRVW